FRLALAEEPGRLLDEVRERQAPGAELNDALRAVDRKSESLAGAVLDLGAERADHAVVEAVGRVDLVAEDRADPFAGLADLALRRRVAGVAEGGEAPAGVAGEEAHEVEDVGAEDHQVFAAAALILLASAAHLDQVAEPAGRDQVADDLHPRAVPRLVGDG